MNCRLYDSIQHVPAEDWQRLAANEPDVSLDPRLLRVLEETLADQCRQWYVLIHDDQNRLAGGACLCLFQVDATITAHPAIQRFTATTRRAWKNFLQFGVLFCGLPVPPGESHLRILPGHDHSAVLRKLHETMRALAAKQRARLIVIKELDAARVAEFAPLKESGYLLGEVPPMHLMPATFRSFDEYRAALNTRYRNQVNRSLKKFQRERFQIRHVHDHVEIERLFTDEFHRLYEAVWLRSETRMEKLPLAFFHKLTRAFPGQVSLTLAYRDNRLAGYTFGLAANRLYHNLYSGLDYELNPVGDLYFNLFYNDLDQAFRRGFDEIQMGQTSDDFKARLGCRQRQLWFYARATGNVFHAGLRAFAPLVFPKLPVVEPCDVFKANGAQ